MTIRVLTFNVRCGVADDGPNSWPFRRQAAAEVIRRGGYDLVGLQEAYDYQNADLLAHLPEYSMVGIGREDGFAAGEFATHLHRSGYEVESSGTFWLSESPDVPGSLAWGARCTRICTWAIYRTSAGVRFAFYNTHLDHEAQEARLNGVRLILSRIDRALPSIVTGDFNADESNPAVQAMRDAGFRDTYREIHPDDDEPGTYHGFANEPEPGKIDYIWISPHWRTVDAKIVSDRIEGRFPSDHFAVEATIELTGSNTE